MYVLLREMGKDSPPTRGFSNPSTYFITKNHLQKKVERKNPLSMQGGGKPSAYSSKYCICGGHSTGDVKKNLHHDGTRRKHHQREGRLLKRLERQDLIRSIAA